MTDFVVGVDAYIDPIKAKKRGVNRAIRESPLHFSLFKYRC